MKDKQRKGLYKRKKRVELTRRHKEPWIKKIKQGKDTEGKENERQKIKIGQKEKRKICKEDDK
jgi:hypothetical protein